MLGSRAKSSQFIKIGQNQQCYLAQPFHALIASILYNTVLESMKHANQPSEGFVDGT